MRYWSVAEDDLVTAGMSPTRIGAPSAKTLGALAVVDVVIAFSLSSTLVKRAETPAW
jgi:hypothetical protein